MNERDDATSQKVNLYIRACTYAVLFQCTSTGSDDGSFIRFCPDVATAIDACLAHCHAVPVPFQIFVLLFVFDFSHVARCVP